MPKVSDGKVNPETQVPDENTTELQTDVLLEDGHGLVIGGLIDEDDRNTQTKIPWLGDLPYVGALFQLRQVVKSRRETIVTLIPHVMPYTPLLAEQNDHEYMRTVEPLVNGPLDKNPRPYEPMLRDTFLNPRWCGMVEDDREASVFRQMYAPEMRRLPPVEIEPPYEAPYQPPCELPSAPEELQQPELIYPIEQASYEQPIIRY